MKGGVKMPIDYYDDGYGCRPTVKITDTGSMSTYEKLCYVLDKIEEIIKVVNDFEVKLDEKEDSVNITNNRKLSETGDFTGTLCEGKKTACEIISDIEENELGIESNADQIRFLVDQFEDGATGLVVDGGFFTDGDIDKQYDGGVW